MLKERLLTKEKEDQFVLGFYRYLYKQGLLNSQELSMFFERLEKGNNYVDISSSKSDVCDQGGSSK